MKITKRNVDELRCQQAIRNENGVAIVTALLVLLLLSFVGITSTYTVLTEKRMVRSDAVFEQNFYLAESAAMEGVQRLANESVPEELLSKLLTGTSKNRDLIIAADDEEPHNLDESLDLIGNDGFNSDDIAEIEESSEVNPNTKRIVTEMPIPSGSSLGLGGSRLYDYMAYGVSYDYGGRAMIKVGYKKRF